MCFLLLCKFAAVVFSVVVDVGAGVGVLMSLFVVVGFVVGIDVVFVAVVDCACC